jgi:hypothetical protein
MSLPIEIIYKIFEYIIDNKVNKNNLIIPSFALYSNNINNKIKYKKIFKINFNSKILFDIKASIFMKIYYPCCFGSFPYDSSYKDLYKFGKLFYMKLAYQKNNKNNKKIKKKLK